MKPCTSLEYSDMAPFSGVHEKWLWSNTIKWQDIRSSIDGDGDGEISREEFVNNAMRSCSLICSHKVNCLSEKLLEIYPWLNNCLFLLFYCCFKDKYRTFLPDSFSQVHSIYESGKSLSLLGPAYLSVSKDQEGALCASPRLGFGLQFFLEMTCCGIICHFQKDSWSLDA